MAAVATVEAVEQAIQKSQASVSQQGDIVRSLKASLKDGKAQQVGGAAAASVASVAAALAGGVLKLLVLVLLPPAGRGGCRHQEAAGTEAGAQRTPEGLIGAASRSHTPGAIHAAGPARACPTAPACQHPDCRVTLPTCDAGLREGNWQVLEPEQGGLQGSTGARGSFLTAPAASAKPPGSHTAGVTAAASDTTANKDTSSHPQPDQHQQHTHASPTHPC